MGLQSINGYNKGPQKGGAFTAGKKVNPRNRPCTQADLKRAVNYATDTAVRQAIKMVLYVLIDKHDAPAADVQQLFDEIQWLSGHINSGALSWGYVDRVLKENDIKIDWGNEN